MATDRFSDRRRPGDVVRGLLPRRSAVTPDPADPSEELSAGTPARDLESVIGDCALYEDGRRHAGRLPLSRARAASARTAGFVWIGLQQPTAGEVEAVAREFDLPELAVEDAVKAHQRPKLETYGDVLFVVLKPVRYVDHDEVVEVAEIAMFIGPSFVVTVRHGESDVLRQLRAELDAGATSLLEHGTTGLLYRALDLAVDGYEETISTIDEDVDQIETQVFSTSTDDHSERIYKLKREIAEFRRAVLPLAGPLQRLAAATCRAFPTVEAVLPRRARPRAAHLGRHRGARPAAVGHPAGGPRPGGGTTERDRATAERDRRTAERGHAQDLRMGGHRPRPDRHRRRLRHELREHARAAWEYGYFLVVGVITTACVALYVLFRRNGWL